MGVLEDRVALVTGAASGMGRAAAELFAAEGAAVAVVDRDLAGAEAVVRTITTAGGRALACACDVTVAQDADRAVERTTSRFGGLDVLFANAGIATPPRPLLETSEDVWDRAMDVNAKGVFLCARAATPSLRGSPGGSIIVNASIMGVRTRPGFSAYAASKAAAIHLARTLALELAPDGVRVNCVAPVATDTPMLATFIGGRDPEEGRRTFIASVPMGRLAQPGDVAAAALFLASDASGFITGAVLPVDGGRGV